MNIDYDVAPKLLREVILFHCTMDRDIFRTHIEKSSGLKAVKNVRKKPHLAVWLLPEYATDGNLQYLAIELYQTLNGLSSDIGKDVFPLNTSLN